MQRRRGQTLGLMRRSRCEPNATDRGAVNNEPRNKQVVLAARGDLDVGIVRRKREKNKEARVKSDIRAEEKSEFQGKTEGSNSNMGGIFFWTGSPAVIPIWSTRTRPNG